MNRRDWDATAQILNPEIELVMAEDASLLAGTYHGPAGVRQLLEDVGGPMEELAQRSRLKRFATKAGCVV